MMDTGERSRYFQELTLNLRYEGFAVKPETVDGLLPVELDGRPLCRVAETGGVRYWKKDVTGDFRSKAKGMVLMAWSWRAILRALVPNLSLGSGYKTGPHCGRDITMTVSMAIPPPSRTSSSAPGLFRAAPFLSWSS